MITGTIKNKVDKIWTDIWAGGITNPLTVIEQLTYLMFIRSLDEKELETEEFESMTGQTLEKIFPPSAAGQSMRWSKFKDLDPRDIYDIMSQRVFPAIKNMRGGKLPDFDAHGEMIFAEDTPSGDLEEETAFARYMGDAMFLIPTPQVLQKIITGLENIYTNDLQTTDMQGDLYEYMLGKLSTAGQNGQFRTPSHIIEMMVALLEPTPDDIVCDPACGTAGFLVATADYVRKHHEDSMTSEQWDHFEGPMFTGFDTDRTMLRISAMNLMLHSISHPNIDYRDSVSKQNQLSEAFTICLANPPFKGTIDAESINDDLKAVTNTKKTELLFLALFLRMLKKGGQCACIVPDGVLFGSSKAHKAIRKELVENHQLRAVISMPSGVFKPYAGVSTAVLVFTKTGAGGTENVWFYDMKADGRSLDDKRSEIDDNDIPDIIARFHNLDAEAARERTEQSFMVPKQEIVDNGYDLSINKYKKIEYVPVEYPPISEILAELMKNEKKISKNLNNLKRELLGDEDPSPSNLDYREIFDRAVDFLRTAELARGQYDSEQIVPRKYIIPEIVNGAFSCELFLKSLLVFSKIEIKKMHELADLWEALPEVIRDDIKQELTSRIEFREENGLEGMIVSVSNAFAKWRYEYEHEKLKVNPGFLHAFGDSLREICCMKYHRCTWEDYRKFLK